MLKSPSLDLVHLRQIAFIFISENNKGNDFFVIPVKYPVVIDIESFFKIFLIFFTAVFESFFDRGEVFISYKRDLTDL